VLAWRGPNAVSFFPAWQGSPLTRRAFLRCGTGRRIIGVLHDSIWTLALKSRTNLIIAVLAAAALAAIAFKSFTRQPAQMASKPTAENCTTEAIKQVTDALERSVLSANCAKLVKLQNE
jgi:entry exclusion lipoprotein TrbK